MKKVCGSIFFLFASLWLFSQENSFKYSAFQIGEWFKFRVHYGIFNACYATLHVKEGNIDGKSVYHVVGKGSTVGFARWFFKVDDIYESYFDKENGRPYKFIRNIYEGGYTKDMEFYFNYDKDIAVLNDKKNHTTREYKIHKNIQDLVSAFYYLRNNYSLEDLHYGAEVDLDMLFDDDGIFKFKLKYLGNEIIKTKFGKVECLKFRPYVQKGFVFREQESLTLWVSNDENKIPIKIKAALRIGSIIADLDAFNGLKHTLNLVK